MKLKLLILAIALCAVPAFGQTPPGGYGPGTGGGSGSSPSSLTTFFNGFMGLSPKDTGATGDWAVDNTCTTNSTTTITCSDAPFTAGNITGKISEVVKGTAFPGAVQVATFTGTITFVNTTTVTVQNAATFTQAATAVFKWGHDDTTGLNSWVTGINAAGSSHSGYVPRGLFYIKNPMLFTPPSSSECQVPLIAANPNGIIGCTLIIQGDGNSMSSFLVPTAGQFNWAFEGAAANNCVFHVKAWASFRLTDFSVVADASAHNTTVTTGLVGLVCLESSAHGYVFNVWTEGAHNTTNTLSGKHSMGNAAQWGPGCFECYIQPYDESNDINEWICDGTCEKETWANGFSEQALLLDAIIGSNAGGTIKQLRIDNVNFFGAGASETAEVGFGTLSSTLAVDPIVISRSRFNNTATGPMLSLTSTAGPLSIDLDTDVFDFSSATNNNTILNIPNGAHANVRVNGGSMNSQGGACTTGCMVANNDATSFVWIGNTTLYPLNSTDTFLFGGTSVANIASLHDTTTPLGIGNGTRGAVTASNFGSFTNCAVTTASPAACGSASAGQIAVPAAAATYTVNTTAVTANSEIIIQQDTSTTAGTRLGVTCNTTVSTALPLLTAKVATTSFTFSLTAPAVNPACFSYHIIN